MFVRRFSTLVILSLFVAVSINTVRAQQQGDDDETGSRGAFLGSRTDSKPRPAPTPKRTSTAPRSTPRQPKSGTGNTANNRKTPEINVNTASNKNGRKSPSTASNSTDPLGLGYTLYMRDTNGDALRIDPAREFKTGDSIRIALESNIDGYLYIFHTENDGAAELLYPDAQLNDGDNFVGAHVPIEVPSNMSVDERLRWFQFDGNPAIEKLYIVLTREPIKGVPTKQALVKLCSGKKTCTWKVTPAVWEKIKTEATAPVKVSKAKDEGQKQTGGEKEKTTRGLGLAADDPEPTVVRMSASSTTNVLVTAIDLVHKK
ncbi:MAG: hypothetical protein NVSMB56_05670 [Pyrinomonadaceae bacterium]